jgi:hypothetical protein
MHPPRGERLCDSAGASPWAVENARISSDFRSLCFCFKLRENRWKTVVLEHGATRVEGWQFVVGGHIFITPASPSLDWLCGTARPCAPAEIGMKTESKNPTSGQGTRPDLHMREM